MSILHTHTLCHLCRTCASNKLNCWHYGAHVQPPSFRKDKRNDIIWPFSIPLFSFIMFHLLSKATFKVLLIPLSCVRNIKRPHLVWKHLFSFNSFFRFKGSKRYIVHKCLIWFKVIYKEKPLKISWLSVLRCAGHCDNLFEAPIRFGFNSHKGPPMHLK